MFNFGFWFSLIIKIIWDKELSIAVLLFTCLCVQQCLVRFLMTTPLPLQCGHNLPRSPAAPARCIMTFWPSHISCRSTPPPLYPIGSKVQTAYRQYNFNFLTLEGTIFRLYTRGQIQSPWLGYKVDSGVRLPMLNVLESTLEWTIGHTVWSRWGCCQLWHRVPSIHHVFLWIRPQV